MGEQGRSPCGSLLEGGHSSIRGLLGPTTPVLAQALPTRKPRGPRQPVTWGREVLSLTFPAIQVVPLATLQGAVWGDHSNSSHRLSMGTSAASKRSHRALWWSPWHSTGGGAQESDVSLPRGGSGIKPRSQGAVLDLLQRSHGGTKPEKSHGRQRQGRANSTPRTTFCLAPTSAPEASPATLGTDRILWPCGPQAPASIFSPPGRS